MILGDVLIGLTGTLGSLVFLFYAFSILESLERKSRTDVDLFLRDKSGYRAFYLLTFSISLFSLGLVLSGIVRILDIPALYSPAKSISATGLMLIILFMRQVSKTI